MRDSFVFYRSFYESIRLLPKKYQLQCYEALCSYALDDVPFEKLSGTAEAILKSFKPQVDVNNRRYENGCKGGRPKGAKGETEEKPNNNQDKSKPKRNDNDNVNENVNENVNVNDNDNALGSSGSGSGQDDEFNIWKKLSSEEIDKIYDIYPNSGGFLLDEVYADVKSKRKKVKDPVAFVIGYAKNVGWDDNAEH